MLEADDSQTYKYKAEIEGFFSSFKEIISCLKSLEDMSNYQKRIMFICISEVFL